MRYGGAIALLAETIRNDLTTRHLPQFTTNTNSDRTEGTFCVSPKEWERLLIKAFQSESYQQDPDYVRAVAYTNNRVNALNQKIREAIYGARPPRFVPGERLVASTPYLIQESVILQTSSECEVVDVHAGQQGSWAVWFLHVLTDEGKYRDITVLHESSQAQFQRLLEVYSNEKRWQEFWELKNLFADLNYAYCLTIHKSQGSTFQNVFVDVQNALINRNIRERNQLLYVAVTRAAKRLFICQ
jgi:exodeoxyribonuclease-5